MCHFQGLLTPLEEENVEVMENEEGSKDVADLFKSFYAAFPESQLRPFLGNASPHRITSLKEQLQLLYLVDCNKINCLLLARRIISSDL